MRVPIKAGFDDFSAAKQKTEQAQRAYEGAVKEAEKEAHRTELQLADLGRLELEIYDQDLRRFVAAFSQIKHKQQLSDFEGVRKLIPDDISAVEFSNVEFRHVDAAMALASGTGAGVATSAAALWAVTSFGAASTGTSISALGGAAATHATLAWLGGGAVAAGGGGMAVGTAVLGGLVAAPLLAVGGLVFDAFGAKALEKANQAVAEADKAVAQARSLRRGLRAIAMHSSELRLLLVDLRDVFRAYLRWLDQLVARDNDFRNYSIEDRERLMVVSAVAVTLRHIIDAPLLTEAGDRLEPLAASVLASGRAFLADIRDEQHHGTSAHVAPV